MESNAGVVIKLCVFALDLFIIIFNFLTLKNYLPTCERRHVEVKNKSQQTYLAGDLELKGGASVARKRHQAAYRNQGPRDEGSVAPNGGYRYNGRYLVAADHDENDQRRDYRGQRVEHKYSKSVCNCDFCTDHRPNCLSK